MMPMPPQGGPAPGGAPPPGGLGALLGGMGGGPKPPMPGGGTGPAMAPGGMPGQAAQGQAALRAGLEALQKALPALPLGSPIHNAVMKAIGDIAKHFGDSSGGAGGGQNPQATLQQLAQMMSAARGAPAPQGAGALQGMMQNANPSPPPPGPDAGKPA